MLERPGSFSTLDNERQPVLFDFIKLFFFRNTLSFVSSSVRAKMTDASKGLKYLTNGLMGLRV